MVKSVIVHSPAGVEIVSKPYLVGAELEALALQASTDFVKALDGAASFESPVSLEILNGGHYYFVQDAYKNATGKECQLATLRAKRRFDEDTQSWAVRVWDEAGVSVAEAGVLLIGDTVATGTTLAGVLSKCIDHMDAASHHCDIIVFAIAGSPACEHHLDALQERLAPHGKELSIYYANAKFNLADNGTDLGFAGAEYDEASKKLIDEAVGDFAASMKCAVWDWGDRFREQLHHLREIQEYFESVAGTPAELLQNIATRLEKAEAEEAAAGAAGAGAAGAGAGDAGAGDAGAGDEESKA